MSDFSACSATPQQPYREGQFNNVEYGLTTAGFFALSVCGVLAWLL